MIVQQIIEQQIVDSLGTNANDAFGFFTRLVDAGQDFKLPQLQE